MSDQIALNPNKIVRFLNKTHDEFTKKDIMSYIEKNDIRMVNFRYVGGDGKARQGKFGEKTGRLHGCRR